MIQTLVIAAMLSAADVGRVRDVDAAYVKAWLKNDQAAVLALFDPEAVIVPQNRGPIRGIDEMTKFWFPAGAKTTIESFENEIAEAGGSGDLAFTRGAYRFTFDYDGKHYENRGNYVMLFRRGSDGGWKITHRMWSDLPRK